MNWTWAALMPHPPIIVPEVGHGREQDAAATLRGTEELCARIRALNAANAPESLLLLSPHGPYTAGSLFLNAAPHLEGSLERFRAPGVRSSLETDKAGLTALTQALAQAGIPVMQGELADITADHGALVPLYYLARAFAGGKLPPVIMGNPSGLTPEQALHMGRVLRDFAQEKRWALLASGDLSHRLQPGAPSGFHADGKVFDEAIVKALKEGDPAILTRMSPSVLKNAGECGLRPSLILLGLCAAPLDVLSYEGPFGVGYCTALWAPQDDARKTQEPQARIGKITLVPRPPQEGEKQPLEAQAAFFAINHAGMGKNPEKNAPAQNHPYAHLARMAIKALLEGEKLPDTEAVAALFPDQSIWDVHKGCFVSIKNKDGSLRGCIGSFGPTQPDLAGEIVTNAVSASTRDPRFPAMKAEELDHVDISVDVLNTPELVEEGMELDPAIWGVIVTQGPRRGLLLPDLPTVTTVAQQISIAAQKGGISDLSGAQIYRFTISRYLESAKGGAA